MNNELLTVLTPTYNRADKLQNLYMSLQNQTSKNFVWLIIDDGSTDGTEEIVRNFQHERSFQIQYIKKDNGGKHTALNVGICKCSTPLSIIVDSDDILLPNAVSIVERYYRKYKNNQKIAVYSFLRCYSNGTPIIKIDKDEFVSSYVQYRIKENHPGDMAEVFKSGILKKYPFPVFANEKFLSEDVVWIQMGLKYESVFINKPIYQCEYLPGGLTDNDKKMKFASPLGSMMRGSMLMKKECGIKANIKGAIIYNCYKHELINKPNYGKFNLTIREKILCFIVWPLGKTFNTKWKQTIR